MIETLKNNPKTSIFGILTVLSEVIRANPDLVSFLPDGIKGYVLGAASVIFAVTTVIFAKDAPSEVKPPKAEVVIEEEEKK
jgi:hypothetical protein